MKHLRQYIRYIILEKEMKAPSDFFGKVRHFVDTGDWGDQKVDPRKNRHPKLNVVVDAVNDAIEDVPRDHMKDFLWGLNYDFANRKKIESVMPPPGEPGSPEIQDGPASPEDEEALENFELAEKIILAFLQSANQGIELIQYHPDKETVSVLGDIFTTLRDDIKKLMQAEDKTGVNPHPGLEQHELLDYVLEELSGWQIFHMAGWENWMPNPKQAAKVMIEFRSDAYKTFTNHWFKDLPEEKQQEWIDWVGGDL